MDTVQDSLLLRERINGWKKQGQRIGLVPTMGYLHEGHLQLIRESKRLADKSVASIFVNPRQFGPSEDLDKYPRNIERDSRLAEENGVDILFYPTVETIYPKGYQTNISVTELSNNLCGKSRPTHFDGVATIVTKLFNLVCPDIAIFGKKDFQQYALIKQLVVDLNFPIEIIGYPIVRESDGLAMSSRNKYLNEKERKGATCLYEALLHSAERVKKDSKVESAVLISEMRELIEKVEGTEIDYIEIVDSTTLNSKEIAMCGNTVALAVYFNKKVRLIDNIQL